MFKFDKADYPLTLTEIQDKVSEIEIFKRYCLNFKELNKDFLSEFYNDTRPSCRIYRRTNGTLTYKDFGSGENYNCYRYVMRKYYCTFSESLNIITNDFNLSKLSVDITPKLLMINDIVLQDNIQDYKPKIKIVSQPYNLNDKTYWGSQKISLSLLEEYKIHSCSHVYLYKKDKTVVFKYRNDNPIYAYEFESNGTIYYKIYKPLEKEKRYKWLFDGDSSIIQGIDQLDSEGDILILTKSLKDVLAYRVLGINAIALQAEVNSLDEALLNALNSRFKVVLTNYDLDSVGIYQSELIMQENGLKYFFMNAPYKDLSEYMVDHTIEEAKIMINKKIDEINI